MNNIRRVIRHPYVALVLCLLAGLLSAGLTQWWLGSDAAAWWGRMASVLAFASCLPPAFRKAPRDA